MSANVVDRLNKMTRSMEQRRDLLKGLGLGAASVAFMNAMSGSAVAQAVVPAEGVNDTNIQRFALNFEYLGAELYTRALGTGGLPTAMVVGPRGQAAGPVMGARAVPFVTPTIRAYVQQLANDEVAHVNFVRNNLGINAVARPTIDYGAFATQAQLAGLGNFDVFASETNFLFAAYVLEEVCVSALRGAIPLIQSKVVLYGTSGLLGTEAYQSGMIRSVLFTLGFADQTNALSYLRTRLANEAGTPAQGNDHGVGTLQRPTVANVDSSVAVPDERTMTQVLQIAYGTSATPPAPGGFFPQGVNMF